jgi:hypothetical protein
MDLLADGAPACCADATFDKWQRGFLFVAHVRGALPPCLGGRLRADHGIS